LGGKYDIGEGKKYSIGEGERGKMEEAGTQRNDLRKMKS
jgi:hypothetical protein